MALNRWAKLYDLCIKCNSTEYEHKAKGMCISCYQKYHNYPKEVCSICNALARVHSRVNGKPVCSKCYKEPMHECCICGKSSSAALKLSEIEFVCDSCYTTHYRKKYICSICGCYEIAAISNETKKICVNCYLGINNECSKCGRSIQSPYLLNNEHVCNRCYENSRSEKLHLEIDINKHLYICCICGTKNEVQKVFSDGSVICPVCFKSMYKLCSSCGNPDFSIYAHIDAMPLCRNCYFKKKFEVSISSMNGNWDYSFADIIRQYFDNKLLTVTYETIYECISNSKEFINSLHNEYLNNNNRLTIESITRISRLFPSQKMLLYDIIIFLNSENTGNSYDRAQLLLDTITEITLDIPLAFQRIIVSYKEFLVKKVEASIEKGWVENSMKFNYYSCYLYVLTAIRFINYINNIQNLRQPTEINNHIIDAYLSSKPYELGNLRHFIKFLNANKIAFMRLLLPQLNYDTKYPIGLSEQKQIQLFDMCLSDNNIKLRDKSLILLMLLFGISPEEIKALKKTNFVERVCLGKQQLLLHYNNIIYELPMIISDILVNHLKTLNSASEYVFPGRYNNSPLSLSSICKILSSFEVTSTMLYHTCVNNAMKNGLYQPALLMRYFSIHYLTATKYFNLIRGSLE